MNKRDVLLATEAHRPHLNAFAEHFNAIERTEHWSQRDITTKWMEAAYRSMRGAFLAGKPWEDNESQYMAIVKRCQRPQETMKHFSAMLGCVVLALEAERADFVGPIYSAMGTNNATGQFFTPWCLSRTMAELTLPEELPDEVLHCQEPAAGVGGMILAADAVLRERGIATHRRVHWVAIDVEFYAMAGCFVQLNLAGISADVIHGNTITLDTWSSTPTLAAIMHPKPRRKEERSWNQEAPSMTPQTQPDLFAGAESTLTDGTPTMTTSAGSSRSRARASTRKRSQSNASSGFAFSMATSPPLSKDA